MLKRLQYWLHRQQLRLEGSSVDLLEMDAQDGLVVLWPISLSAQNVMTEMRFVDRDGNPARPRKHWGGYLVRWETREALHHGPCPLIMSLASFGTIIDTP